jgi:hypothetical protein
MSQLFPARPPINTLCRSLRHAPLAPKIIGSQNNGQYHAMGRIEEIGVIKLSSIGQSLSMVILALAVAPQAHGDDWLTQPG